MITLGIDIGTSNTLVCLSDGEILTHSTGSKSIPSLVAFTNNNERFIGEEAFPHYNQSGCLKLLQYLCGKSSNDILNSLFLKYLPSGFNMNETDDNELLPCIEINNKSYSTTSVLAMLISHINKRILELYATDDNDIVLAYTLPCTASSSFRRAIIEANTIAGIESKNIKLISSDDAIVKTYERKLNAIANSTSEIPKYALIFEMGMTITQGK